MGRKEKGSQAQETVWLKVCGKEKPGAFRVPQTVSVRGGERWAWKDGLHRRCLVHHAEEFWLYKQQIVVDFLKKCLKFFDFRFLFGKVNTLHMKQNSKDKMTYNQIYVLPALIPQGSSQGQTLLPFLEYPFWEIAYIQANANNVFFFHQWYTSYLLLQRKLLPSPVAYTFLISVSVSHRNLGAA